MNSSFVKLLFISIIFALQANGQTYPYLNDLSNTTYRNFIRTYIPQQPTSNSGDISLPNQNVLNCIVSTDYFDGLGRSLQSVKRNAFEVNNVTGNYIDLVQQHVYDSIGRETFKYLPFSKHELSAGKLKQDPLTQISTQYTSLYPGDHVYTELRMDFSPLNRIDKELPPGASWVGSDRGKTNVSVCNNSSGFTLFDLLRWNIGYSTSITANIPTVGGHYHNDGELQVKKTIDEDGVWQMDFINKSGQTIAKMQHTNFAGTSPVYWYRLYILTYYIYDDFGRLRFVIPPEAYTQMISAGSITNDIANGLCYEYLYDEKGRLIEKKLPGKSVEYFIYDSRDRLILTQDGNLSTINQWKYTFYDELDRVLQSGLFTPGSSYSRASLQSVIDGGGITSTTSILYYLTHNLFGIYPSTLTDADILVTNYYDDYSNSDLFSSTFNSSFNSQLTGPAAYSSTPMPSTQTRGLLIGNTVKVLDPFAQIPGPYRVRNGGGDPWIRNVNFYDDDNHIIQVQKQNHTNGIDISTNQYSFGSQLVCNYLQSTNPLALGMGTLSSSLFTTTDIIKKYDIDYFNGNVKRLSENINNRGWQLIKRIDYDDLGRIKNKNLLVADNYYDYNVRNWITGINKSYFGNTTATNIFFCEKLSYDDVSHVEIPSVNTPIGGLTPRYNGNISAMYWKGYQGSLAKCYSYSYDNQNRVINASFSERESPCVGVSPNIWDNTSIDYTMSNVTYDNNGNILTMNQMGTGPTFAPVQMDLMQYKLTSHTNQIQGIKDNATITTYNHDFKDDAAHSQTDFTYDNNGNLITDNNKGISTMHYNFLDKPDKIVNSSGHIYYIYDALGNKLQKDVGQYAGDLHFTTDYVGPMQYNDWVLHNISHDEGRSRPIVTGAGTLGFLYDYFIKDHLENVRSVIGATEELIGTTVAVGALDFGLTEEEPGSGSGSGGSLGGGIKWSGDAVEGNPSATMYRASFELPLATLEESVFSHMRQVRADKPASLNQDDQKAAKLEGIDPDKRIAAALMLRVMPGDYFSVSAKSYFEEGPNAIVGNGNDVLATLINTLGGGLNAPPIGGENTAGVLWQNALSDPNLSVIYNDITSGPNFDSLKPAAFLNYVVYNDNMKIVPEKCKSIQISGEAGVWNTVASDADITIDEPGYVTCYVSSVASSTVYMDAVAAIIHRGRVIEENHYYPFGLNVEIASGYSGEDNNYKFSSKELQRNELTSATGVKSGLDWEDYGARMYDPQIGRWNGIDPMAIERTWLSTYNFVQNNPVNRTDISGELDDWVHDADGNIKWDKEATSQATTKPGETYIGKTVVIINGSEQEKLGEGQNLFGKGANLADVTVYGPGGKNDIEQYKGYTMTSDYSTFGAIDNGNYTVNFRNPGKSGALKSNWAISNTSPINCLGGVNPSPIHPYSSTQKDGVYIHTSNKNGFAGKVNFNAGPKKGTLKGAITTGCLLIVPTQYDVKGNVKSIGWDEFNKQLKGVKEFHLELRRKKK